MENTGASLVTGVFAIKHNSLFKPDTVYQTIMQRLRDHIKSGKMEQGQKFFTEREIAAQCGISRPTANKILTGLVSEGLLEFRKGVGTFIRKGTLGYDLRHLVSFTEKSEAIGQAPVTKVLRFELRSSSKIDNTARWRLGLHHDEPVYYFERLRLSDDTPVILERRYVPHRFCPDLTKQALEGSLYALWTKTYHLSIGGAEQTIQAINLNVAQAKYLRAIPEDAALKVTAVGRLENNEPLWYEETIYSGKAYEFHVQLGGIHPGRPAVGRLKLKS